MNTIEKYLKFKKQVELLSKEIDQAKGAYDEIMRGINDQFGCSTIEDAQDLFEGLDSECSDLEAEIEEKLSEWNERWGIKISENYSAESKPNKKSFSGRLNKKRKI